MNEQGHFSGGSNWMDGVIMQQEGHEITFNRDFNGDGRIGAVIADENADGLVDGSNLSAYQLFQDGIAITLMSQTGRTYNDSFTPSWDVIQAVEVADEWKVLLQGAETNSGSYFIWTTNQSGIIQSGSGWKTPQQMQSHETIFNRDFNADGFVGDPPTVDDDSNGIVDRSNSTAYLLYDNGTAIRLINRDGEPTTMNIRQAGMQ